MCRLRSAGVRLASLVLVVSAALCILPVASSPPSAAGASHIPGGRPGMPLAAAPSAVVQRSPHAARAAILHSQATICLDSLAGYWRMNGDGTDLVSGNTLVPEANVSFGPGHLNQAVTIDGSQVGGLSAPALHAYDLLPTGFTVETWIRTSSLPGVNPRIVCAESSAVTQAQIWQLDICKFNCPEGLISFSVLRYGVETELRSTRAINDGDWHHVAVTYDGSDLRLYIDGVQDGSLSASGLEVRVGGGTVHVGRQVNTADQYDGQIDELRIWQLARSAEAIAADMGQEICYRPTGVCQCDASDTELNRVRFSWADVTGELGYRVYRDGTLLRSVEADTTCIWDVPNSGTHQYCVEAFDASGSFGQCCDSGTRPGSGAICASPDSAAPVAYWRLEGNGNDDAGGNPLTVGESVSYIDDGVIGKAASFNGYGDMYTTALPAYDLLVSGFTVDLWVRFRGYETLYDIDLIGASAAPADSGWWGIRVPGGVDIRLCPYGGDYYRVTGWCSDAAISRDQWHHIALRYDGSDLTLYVDGAMEHSENAPGLCAHVGGGKLELLGGWGSFNGYVDIDEVRIWMRALTPAEIQLAAQKQGSPLPPPAPASCTATDGEACQPVQISWPDVEGETGYRVYQDGSLIAEVSADQTSTTDTPASGPHLYSVKASNHNGLSPQIYDISFMPWPQPTWPLMDLTVSTMDSVRLVWGDVAGEAGYHVMRNGVLIGTTLANETVFVDHDPVEGTSDYCIEAFNLCGASVQRCVSVTYPCRPPTVGWARDVSGQWTDVGQGVVQAQDGGFASGGSIGGDFCLFKLDSLGGLLWKKTYGTSRTEKASALDATRDGGFILAGTTSRTSPTLDDFYVVKTNSVGDTVWTRTYGGAWQQRCRAVCETSDNGFLVVGTNGSQPWMVKINVTGDTLWTRKLALTGVDPWARMDVCQASDGSYVLSVMGEYYQPYLIKTDASGNQLWAVPVNVHESVAPLPDGGFVLAGYYSYGSSLLEKVDPEGAELWTQDCGFTLHDAVPAADGGFMVVGEGCCSLDGNTVAMIGKTDSLGNVLWSRSESDSGTSAAYGMTAARDGGYVLSGSRRTPADVLNGYVAKRGCSVSQTAAVDRPAPLPTRVALSSPAPNPTRGAIRFRVSLPRAAEVRVAVFDVSGRLVKEIIRQSMPAGVHLLRWDPTAEASLRSSGIYFMRLDAGGVHESRSIVLLK